MRVSSPNKNNKLADEICLKFTFVLLCLLTWDFYPRRISIASNDDPRYFIVLKDFFSS